MKKISLILVSVLVLVLAMLAGNSFAESCTTIGVRDCRYLIDPNTGRPMNKGYWYECMQTGPAKQMIFTGQECTCPNRSELDEFISDGSILIAQVSFEDLLRRMEGRRYAYDGSTLQNKAWIDVQDSTFILQTWDQHGGHTTHDRIKIQGKQTTVRFTTHPNFLRVWAVSSMYIISNSGDRIQIRTQFSDGDYRNYNYILE